MGRGLLAEDQLRSKWLMRMEKYFAAKLCVILSEKHPNLLIRVAFGNTVEAFKHHRFIFRIYPNGYFLTVGPIRPLLDLHDPNYFEVIDTLIKSQV